MTTTHLTDQQRTALSAHDRTVSLAAGAGCGKTFVLTERFLSYLDPSQLEPTAELQELVAITFTDAAAREMRDRVRRRCYQRLDQSETPSERSAWKQLLSSLDGARISTIHSFCSTLLRNHAAEAGLDPRFELLDPPAAQLLRLQTLDDHLRHLLIASDERLIQLATHFQLRNLRDHAAQLLGSNVQAVAQRWLGTSPAQLAAHWRARYQAQFASAALATLAESEPIQQLHEFCTTVTAPTEKAQSHFDQLVDFLAAFSNAKHPQPAAQQLRDLAKVQGVCTKKQWEDVSDHEYLRDTCKAVRELIDGSLLRAPFEDETLLQATAALGLDLLHLVADVELRYTRVKQQRNVLEHDDLLTRTHALLTDDRYPHVQENLSRNTRLLMVDEFQDTDPLQVAIVQALRGEAWAKQGLFVVGDSKQSIYRFRGAEPRVSNELRATLPVESQLSLTTNFRSQPAITHFVNALFHDSLADSFSEDYQPLVAHRPQQTPTPAIEFLWALPDEKQPKTEHDRRLGETQRARMQEARYLARRLAQLLDEGDPLIVDADEPTARPLQLGDIAILLRTLSDVPLYEEALREYGLDYYLVGGHAFYTQQEIYDVLHLLRSLASPADELSLAGLLRSPMFALEDETLLWLVEHAGSLNGGLFANSLPDELSPSEQAKVLRAANTLNQLRQQKDQLLVAELLGKSIALTGYDAILQTEFLGHRKWANVQKLVEQARTLDRTRPGDLVGFVTQLSEFVVRAPKEALAATSAEGDVIRIMTIHQAKGLEFPLVVLPDLDRTNFSGSHLPLFDEQLGPLVPTSDKKKLVGWDLHHFAEKEQDQEERKRLLYVACTRAADYLLLSSSVKASSIKDLQNPKSDWLKLLAAHFDLTTGACLTQLPAGYAAPEIRVTTTEPTTTCKPSGPTHGVDLQKLITNTHQLAEAGKGQVPAEVQPIPADPSARRRFSFSQISGKLVTITDDAKPSPTKNEPTPYDPRTFGTHVHAALERLDFSKPTDDLLGLCEHLAPLPLEKNWKSAAAEAATLIQTFLGSPRAAQLATAQQIHREIEFLLPWPPNQQPNQPPNEGRYLQGYLDCLYQDPAGDWHLLDYKTNQTDAAGVPQTAEHYALQMYVYGLASKQALGVAPVESVLHFLRPNCEFSFTWDEATHTRLATQIDQAIASQLFPDKQRD